jgi:hypothetical protein
MDTTAATTALETRLRRAGFTTEHTEIAGHPALVGRRADFRWNWVATRLHSFVVAFTVDDLDEPTAETLTAAAQSYAIKHKGGLPRGLQTGSATLAVFLVDTASPSLRAWFSRKPHHRFGALRWPVLLELSDDTTTSYTGPMATGSIYRTHLRGLVADVIAPPAPAG